MPRGYGRDPGDVGDGTGTAGDDEILFEESPGLSVAAAARPERWVRERLRRLSPLRRALLGGIAALILATGGFAVFAGFPSHTASSPPSALADRPAALPVYLTVVPSGCSFARIDATHSLAQCVWCDAHLSNYGLLCRFRDTVVIASTTRPAIGCSFLPSGVLVCSPPAPAGAATSGRVVAPRG